MCLNPTHFVVDVLRVDAGVPVRAAGPGEDGCRHGLHRCPHLGVGGGLAQAGLRGHSVVSQGSGNTLDLLSIVLYCVVLLIGLHVPLNCYYLGSICPQSRPDMI